MQTIAEKIMAAHSGENTVKAGDYIKAKLDLVMGSDVTVPLAIKKFKELGFTQVFDPDKVVFVFDHLMPAKDVRSAKQHQFLRNFARQQKIINCYDLGEMGIEHALLPEQGHIYPGQLMVGADSHTCTNGALGAFATGVGSTDLAVAMGTGELWFRVPETIKLIYKGKLPDWVSGKDLILYTIGKIGAAGATYQVMEFTGEIIEKLPMEDRFTMCNMAIEAGGKTGIVPPDEITEEYLKGRVDHTYQIYHSDEDANYVKKITFNVSELEPQVAFPFSPANVYPVSKAEDIKIDEAIIGSCTNGRLEDLRRAASILKGRKVNKGVRLIIIPATQQIYRQAMQEGLFDIFLEAGATISMPTCGPCFGGHTGILGPGEKAITSTNRNFKGRIGSPESEVYLASPAVVAASAVAGKIVHPEEVVS